MLLVRTSHLCDKIACDAYDVTQVEPFGVSLSNERFLPKTGTVLDLLLTGNGSKHASRALEVQQLRASVPSGEHRADAGFVFGHSANQVGRHTGVQHRVASVRHDVDVGISHTPILMPRSMNAMGFPQVDVGNDSPVASSSRFACHPAVFVIPRNAGSCAGPERSCLRQDDQ